VFFTQKRLKLYLGALLVLQLVTIISILAVLRTPHGHYIDFRTFYTAGYMLRTHQAPFLYDYPTERRLQSALVSPEPRALPMMSPPFTALLFVLLSHLPFRPAHAVFAAINILLLLACIALLQPFVTALSARWSLAPALFVLTFLPVCLAVLMGQLSVILLFIYCAVFVCLRRGRDLLAGLILSLAMMKFQVAIPIALLFLLWRQWRFLAGFLTGSAVLTALSIRILGPAAFMPYLHSLYSMTHTITADHYMQAYLGILPHEMPNLYGLLFVSTHGAAWSHLVIILLSAALLLWTALQRPSLPLALCTAALVSYHLFFYDLTILLLPLTLLFDHLIRTLEPAADQPRDYRLLITQISLGTLLLAPFIRLLIATNETFWLALPIFGLVLCSPWWPTLLGTPDAAPVLEPSPEPVTDTVPISIPSS
jgi:hypothetical protein